MEENAVKQKQLEEEAHVETKYLYEGKVFKLRQDELKFSDQPPHVWDIVEHPGAVAIIPINEKGNLYLIKQWRRAIGKIIYEIPAGTLDEGDDPLSCAERELQEEIGYKAKEFLPMGGIHSAPGFCNEYIHLFIGKNLEPSSLPGDTHEAIDVVEISLEEALDLIDREEITDAKTIAAVLRYARSIHDA